MKRKQPRTILIIDFHFLPIFNRPMAFFLLVHLKADKGHCRFVIIKETFFCVQLTTGREKNPSRASGHICGRFMVDALITVARLRWNYCWHFGKFSFSPFMSHNGSVIERSIIGTWNAIIGICIRRETSFRWDC